MSAMLLFSKMHGLGNDFVVIDGLSQKLPDLTISQRRFLADRHRGIGCDWLTSPPSELKIRYLKSIPSLFDSSTINS